MAARKAGPTERVRLVPLAPGLAGIAGAILVLWLLRGIAPILLLFFLAVLLGVYLDALRGFILAHTRFGPRVSFAVALLITLLIVYGIGELLLPPVIEQTRQLVARLPDLARGWQQRLSLFVQRFPALAPYVGPDKQTGMINAAIAEAQQFVGNLLPKVFDLVDGFIKIVSVLVMGIYLALHPRTYEGMLIAVTPPRYRAAARDVLVALSQTLRAWTLSQLIAMFVLGALSALGLWAVGVPSWLTFGIFTGLAAIVPFFGTLVSTLLPALFVLGGEGGVSGALLVLLVGVVVHLIEGNVISPLIMERGVKLPPVASIMAVLIVGTLLGPVGLLVAVPMLAVVMVLVRKILIERVYGDVDTEEEEREDSELGLAPRRAVPPAVES
ncbi:MAG TPA: AI-2E family transporter [Gemmatimonadaceae bacterium]|nr:AI-2E family transporter [Gemmatimonadaceae bacterium]